MALAATTIWEARSTATGSMVNGGGFNASNATPGTDFSQQDAAHLVITDLVIDGADNTKVSSALTPFSATSPGNILRVNSGGGFTPQWYEVVSVASGVATLDRPVGITGSTAGVARLGGALSFNSTLDDDLFEALVGGNILYVKAGTYSVGESISVASTSGTAENPIRVIGYNSTRGDIPTGASRPTIALAASTITIGATSIIGLENLIFTGTAASVVSMNASIGIMNCRLINTSTTAGRAALTAGADVAVHNCECVSQNGTGIVGNSRTRIIGCYVHDSNIGMSSIGSSMFIAFNVVEGSRSQGIRLTSTTGNHTLLNNTIYGREAKVGTGLDLAANPSPNNLLYNNIFYGLATGIAVLTTEQKSNRGHYNDFFNNTTNATNYTLGPTAITTDPSFVGASQVTGTTATTAGSVLTQAGGDFSSVTNNVDYLHVLSGTGVTLGGYLITAHTGTTLTVNNALGTSAAGDVTYYVTTGHNFKIGTNLKAAGFPGEFPGSETIAYIDVGAVQRQEPAGGGGGGGGWYPGE